MGTEAKAIAAVDLLRRDILNGTHPPGQPLRIAALSQRYGVSATPLREALSRLEEMQLVVAYSHRGWRVAPVSLAEFQDLLHSRLTLETALLEDAMASPLRDWEADLVAAHYRLAHAVPPLGDADTLAYRQTWIAVHDGFHTALLAGARSHWLKRFYGQILAQLQRHHQAVMQRFHPVTAQIETELAQAFSMPRHTELMVAVLDRDAAAATAALEAHNAFAMEFFLRFLGEAPAETQKEMAR